MESPSSPSSPLEPSPAYRFSDTPTSVKMSRSHDQFNTKTTSISYPWPSEVTGLERIALTAQGDLQRLLSAYFARPITIALVYSHTLRQSTIDSPPVPLSLPNPPAIASASPSSPITQTRQVHLQCGGKIACTATSIVRITSPEVARLFLEEKYAIGQMFRRMEKMPAFELTSVGTGPVEGDEKNDVYHGTAAATTTPTAMSDDSNQLWRRYKLVVQDFECEILEVFPDRDMLVDGEAWLAGESPRKAISSSTSASFAKDYAVNVTLRLSRTQQSIALLTFIAFVLMVAFEGALFYGGRAVNGHKI